MSNQESWDDEEYMFSADYGPDHNQRILEYSTAANRLLDTATTTSVINTELPLLSQFSADIARFITIPAQVTRLEWLDSVLNTAVSLERIEKTDEPSLIEPGAITLRFKIPRGNNASQVHSFEITPQPNPLGEDTQSYGVEPGVSFVYAAYTEEKTVAATLREMTTIVDREFFGENDTRALDFPRYIEPMPRPAAAGFIQRILRRYRNE